MIKCNNIEFLKEFADTQMDMYPDGVLFAIIKDGSIVWSQESENFHLEGYQEGCHITHSIINEVIATKKKLTEVFFDTASDQELKMTAVFVVEDEAEQHSVFITVVPMIHPLLKAFPHFAPIVAEIFNEGSLISITDKTKVLAVNRSEEYDIPAVVPGFSITDTEVDQKAMATGKCVHDDDDTMIYGPPIRVLAAPYFDCETKEMKGVVNILRPKNAELSLKNLSSDMEKNLSDAVITIQEIAAASSTIHLNEQELNDEIEEITNMADKITEISNLIKTIANSTKMLGLNASIEAARAGSSGRGFGVVAEEINKLSIQVIGTVPKIQELTNNIKGKVDTAKSKSNHSLASSQEQVASTEEMSAVIESIQSASTQMADLANKI